MMKKILLIFFVVLNSYVYSQKIKYISKIEKANLNDFENTLVYSLPKTVIKIQVKLSYIVTIPGDYCLYAEDLLGIKNVPTVITKEWKIDSLILSYSFEADQSETYIVKFSNNTIPPDYFTLLNNGFIVNLNYKIFNNKIDLKNPDIKPQLYLNPTFEPFKTNIIDTTYRVVLKDSILVKVPVVKFRSEKKTIEERAHNAAEIISKIRRRKFEMITAEDEPLAQEGSLRYAFSELNKFESKYLELFIGHKDTQRFELSFYYVPVDSVMDKEVTLFYFSKEKGISSNKEQNSVPVLLSITNIPNADNVKSFSNKINTNSKCLFYKIPSTCTVSLKIDEQYILNNKIPIFQYGYILPYGLLK